MAQITADATKYSGGIKGIMMFVCPHLTPRGIPVSGPPRLPPAGRSFTPFLRFSIFLTSQPLFRLTAAVC
jgi:hypothetical protein